jgi:hypothetical protein
MTRINVVDPAELLSPQLLAEYVELPRVFTLAAKASKTGKWKLKQPQAYTFGPGHLLFFYDKLSWLSRRHKLLVRELKKRGYNLKFTGSLRVKWRGQIPAAYWGDYVPTEEAKALNWERIHLRAKGKSWNLKQ